MKQTTTQTKIGDGLPSNIKEWKVLQRKIKEEKLQKNIEKFSKMFNRRY